MKNVIAGIFSLCMLASVCTKALAEDKCPPIIPNGDDLTVNSSIEAIKNSTANWTWFTDYAFVTAEWTVYASQGRLLEVGTGMKIWGSPRGAKRKFSNKLTFQTFGLGAIHIRVTDGKGPARVRLDRGGSTLFTIAKGCF